MNSIAEPLERLDHVGVARLLAPLSAEAPCGPPTRYDPVFTEIRLLREEDDPQLPMGQWERPLKRADWPAIEARCVDMLTMRSKDLQIAVWLVEAWTRQQGFDGLRHGLHLLDALLRTYWDELHPLIEFEAGEHADAGSDAEPDLDARLAPLEWLNESLGASLRVHTVLVSVGAGKPAPVTLADWERMTMREMAPEAPLGRNQDPVEAGLTRADVIDGVSHLQAELAWMETAVEDCQDSLATIAEFLRTRLAALAPNLGKLAATLAAARRVLAQLHGEAMPAQSPEVKSITPADAEADADAGSAVDVAEIDRRDLDADRRSGGAPWRNRKDAYATLEALADYLAEVEPHSPTPFLIRRAASWGRMSLPEVIAEIIREEGDVNRLFNILGVKQ
jgi:type VI secretion system protein ImpA